MYNVRVTTEFEKDLKRIKKRGYDIDLLSTVVNKLIAEEQLDATYRDHPLQGRYKGCRECHITPDWLLMYEIVNKTLILLLTRTGHAHRLI